MLRSQYHIIEKSSKEILKNLGYDVTKDIHSQFMERYAQKFINKPPKKKPGPVKKEK